MPRLPAVGAFPLWRVGAILGLVAGLGAVETFHRAGLGTVVSHVAFPMTECAGEAVLPAVIGGITAAAPLDMRLGAFGRTVTGLEAVFA